MKIKEYPEDFLVKEISEVQIQENGKYAYFILKKINYNTIDAIKSIAKALDISPSRFGFAGNKDKKAVTEQMVSVDSEREKLENIQLKDIGIRFAGYGDNYIHLGNLKGNEFTITVRDMAQNEYDHFLRYANRKPNLIPNLFGEQRFSHQNADVGKALIKCNFDKATQLLNLDVIENDFIGAIRRLDKRLLRLFVHAYQSLIFNRIVNEYIKYSKQNTKIPLVGFGTDLENYNPDIRSITERIMADEGITTRDFVTLKIPELSEEGDERDLLAEIKNLKMVEKRGNRMRIRFFLQKGVYATEALKFLFSKDF